MRFIPESIGRWWPWVTRSRYERLKQENYSLRDALREANAELRKHRTLIAGLRDGDKRMTEAVERALSR
jgi:protoporphyrinogen oxidase